MEITKIFSADICRDGGSYSLSFESTDGEWYEFFIQVKSIESTDYFEPKIYKNGINSGELTQKLTWGSAKKFLVSITYDNVRFNEMVDLVANNENT